MFCAHFGGLSSRFLAAALALIATSAGAQTLQPDSVTVPASQFDGWLTTPAGAKNVEARVASGKPVLDKAMALGFSGEIIVDAGDLLLLNWLSPDLKRAGLEGGTAANRMLWPYASVTKQLVAARFVAELDAGGFSLDTPISEFVPQVSRSSGPVPTIRQLLQHRSGLRNPDETPTGDDGWPEFYTKPEEYGLDWCLQSRTSPPAKGWSYNNCDYIVLGAAFDQLSFESWQYMMSQGKLADAKNNLKIGAQTVITRDNVDLLHAIGSPEDRALPAYGASGALGGSLFQIAFANWMSMKRYESDIEEGGAKAAFWKGDHDLGFMALGHWVFTVQPKQCDAPVVVSQRKGEIGRYQLENIMLPQLKRSMVFATAEAGTFEFGEVWSKEGFLYEAVGQLACGDKS